MDAIPFIYRRLRTMSDGTVRMEIDIEPNYALATMTLFNEPNLPGAIARITQEFSIKELQTNAHPYGEMAKRLRQSGFFRIPDVWRAVGTDEQLLQWIREQDCSFKKSQQSYGRCDGDIVAAHVRRIENGAGTAIKPPYSAIPLCDYHHGMQHKHGEQGGREHWDKLRIKYVEQWAWETLKAKLGYQHWYEVEPIKFIDWVNEFHLEKYLPYGFSSDWG